MAYNKGNLLDKAIKITEAYATSSNCTRPSVVLRNVYEELKKINEELE